MPSNEHEINLVKMTTQEAIIINQHGPGVDIKQQEDGKAKLTDEQRPKMEDKETKDTDWGVIVTDNGYRANSAQALQDEHDHEDLYLDNEQLENAEATTKGTIDGDDI